MSKQSTIIQNDDNHTTEQTISSTSRVTSLAILQQKQHLERKTANNLACDEQHDLTSKYSSSSKNQTRQFPFLTNNNNNNNNNTTNEMTSTNYRAHTPVDSFVQLNLKPAMEISLQDYKKARVSSPTTKISSSSSNINNRSSLLQSNGINESNITPNSMMKKPKKSLENQYHEEASLDYFFKNDEDDRQPTRSSSSSSTTSFSTLSNTNNESIKSQLLPREYSKPIVNNDFDSHGSSIATKSSSENSGSARTGSCSDSDDEHHLHSARKPDLFSKTKTKPTLLSATNLFNNDATPTMVLNTTSDHRLNQHDRISSLPTQDSYELVQLNSSNEHHLCASQLPRFKLSAIDDPNGNIHSSNDILSYTTQRPQSSSSSSHQNQNSERHDQHNVNHSNSSRKSTTRASKKRKQLQQQETIRTELIPGHRGDRDVDELVMFIDGESSSKQRHNSVPLRITDTNTSTTRRKFRKSIKDAFITTNNEDKTSHVDEDIQSISFVDEEDQTTTSSHSIDNTSHGQSVTEISLPNDDESHSSPNTTNGEISAPEWLEPIHSTSPINDDNDSFSLSSAILNDSNSEITSEPFVTVTHRRRLTKERRQDSNPSTSSNSRTSHFPSSNTNDKRRFPPPPPPPLPQLLQNGTARSTMRNGPSNIKPSSSMSTKEESIISPAQSISQTSVPPTLTSISNTLNEQLSPRLSSHSSSSSLSSSQKRQSKPPPVVFVNKSEDVELNDVSFGFDVENPIIDKPITQTLSSSSPLSPTPPPLPSSLSEIEKESEDFFSTQLPDTLIDSKSSSFRRSYQQQRSNGGQVFYSGSDIHTYQHNNRNYPFQTTPITQPSYIDPLLLLQLNQQRLAANYPQQFAYMNLVRAPYMSSQTPYVLIPTTYTTGKSNDTIDQDEKTLDEDTIGETIQSSEHVQEPLVVYTTIPAHLAPVYMQPIRKEPNDLEQPIPISPFYSSQQYYPSQGSYAAAYFQPITPASLLIESKSHPDDTDNENDNNDYERSSRLLHQTRQQSSSHIMSNALQLVYSQERRNAQTDRFNLDQLTAYLAMKWTDAVDGYEQGDDEILLTDEQ
ncbi:hypothetical protein I4U23_025527 [Adineta vaga]|nr:hypothetical protein I4U23_025527 [Adineta vaga]